MPVGDLTLPALFALLLGVTAARYLIFAGGAWIVGYLVFPRRWAHRKIVPRPPESADIRREVHQSLSTMAIFAMVGCATFAAAAQGWTQLYRDPQAYGWGWFWASIAIAIVVHDTYFYWTHRLMHHPRLYRHVHLAHHRSTNPTPWAAYSFSPWEAVIEAGIFPLLAFTLPMHPLALSLFLVWQILFNVLGHTGYEYNHRTFATSPIRYLINTPTNHIMHHQRVSGNFGLYFNWWDRLMGTNHPDYDERLRDLTNRTRSTST
jgi:Delta7-sterol 5-desaturase